VSDVRRRPVIAIVAHARDVPASERERFAASLRANPDVQPFIVETCHRVEAYVTGASGTEPLDIPWTAPAGGRVLTGEPAVRHAVVMATGLDSVVLGEDQILHQIRASLEAARISGTLDPEIDRLFALALQAGRRARSWRSGRPRSLADVALEAMERTVGPVRDREVLVVGAGRMGALVARAGAAAGAMVTIANRSPERARALARAVAGQTADLDPGPEVGRFAGVVIALSGRWDVDPATAGVLVGGSQVVADLSVPSAVPERLAAGLGGRLVTADDLARREADIVGDRVPEPRSDELIDRAVQAFVEWAARSDARAAADALVRHADLEREAELAALWRKLPALEPEARVAIEGMTRHLAARLLKEPLERLGRDTDGVEGRAVRDLFAL
jgi:glutamyl-tRNA reductase